MGFRNQPLTVGLRLVWYLRASPDCRFRTEAIAFFNTEVQSQSAAMLGANTAATVRGFQRGEGLRGFRLRHEKLQRCQVS